MTEDVAKCTECGAALPLDSTVCPNCSSELSSGQTTEQQLPNAATIPPATEQNPSDGVTLPPTKATPQSEAGDFANQGETPSCFGDYELIEEIARGGMGVVYLARQISLNREVAVKMILAGQLASAQDVQRFYSEAEAAANLHHPGIVPIYEVGKIHGQHYFSMEYIDGSSLTEVTRDNPLPPEKAAQYLKAIADAIEYAHAQGTLHRDLKPSNILIDSSDQPRITDFGLAKRVEGESELTASGAILGTPSYMPPEQAAAKHGQVAPPSDVYSLGAVLYELLTGRPPFRTDNTLDTLMQVMEDDPVSPRQLNPTVPKDLETICLQCLEKEPRRRYQTARELAEELDRFLADEPIQSRPISAAERTWRWCKRKPMAAGLTAVLVFVFGIVFPAVAYVQLGLIRENNALLRARGVALEQAKSSQADAVQAQTDAERDRDAARDAQEDAQDHLARSLVDQARAVRLTNRSGRRWRALELLGQAESLRSRQRARGSSARREAETTLPSQGNIRTEAVASLMLSDGRIRRQWKGLHHSVSPDGGFVAIGALNLTKQPAEYSVELIGLGDNKTLRRWGPEMASGMTALGPDGKTLATAAAKYGGAVSLWDTESGEQTKVLDWPEVGDTKRMKFPRQLQFSGDGRYLAAIAMANAETHTVLWGLTDETAEIVSSTKRFPTSSIGFTDDSTRLVCPTATNQLLVWDIKNRTAITQVAVPNVEMIGSASISGDGRTLAVTGYRGEDQPSAEAVIWDLEKNREKRRIKTDPTFWFASALSPDGSRLALGDMSGRVVCFLLHEGKEEFQLEHGSMPQLLCWSKDGKRLFSSGIGSLKEWELLLDQPQNLFRAGIGQSLRMWTQFAYSPNAKWLAIANGKQLDLYRWPSREFVRSMSIPSNAQAIQFNDDASRLAVKTATGVALLRAADGKQLAQLEANIREFKTFSSCCFDADQRCLAAGSDKGRAGVWDVETGKPVWQSDTKKPLGTMTTLSPNGRLVATWTAFSVTNSSAESVQLWDVNSGKAVHQLSSEANSAVFSPRGNWLAVTSGGGITQRLSAGRSGLSTTTSFNVSESEELDLEIWNATTGTRQCEFVVTDARTIAFSPDEKLVAIRTKNESVDLWQIEQGRLLFRWSLPKPKEPVAMSNHTAFSGDGRYLAASIGATGSIYLLDLVSVRQQLSEINLDW